MNRTWSNKDLRLLKKHYPIMPTPQLAKLLGKTDGAVKTRAGKLGIKKEIASNNPYSPEKLALLKELYPNMLNTEIAKKLSVSVGSVISAGFRYKLRKTPEFLRLHQEKGMFKPNNPPKNKGKKMSEYVRPEVLEKIKKTQFKKGTVPPNHRPVGYERISKDGYVEVKVGEGMRQFRLKHRVVYEQYFGKIPKGYNVEFKDRNKRNFSPDNLVLRTRKENMKLNSYHNYPKEIANTIQLIGALNRQINKRKTL